MAIFGSGLAPAASQGSEPWSQIWSRSGHLGTQIRDPGSRDPNLGPQIWVPRSGSDPDLGTRILGNPGWDGKITARTKKSPVFLENVRFGGLPGSTRLI